MMHSTGISTIEPATLQHWFTDGDELALIDVREAGEFAAGHPLFASSIPIGVFEPRLLEMVPMPHCRLIIADDGYSDRAEHAARSAVALGYSKVFRLSGGVAAWQRAGMTLYEGQFVPSKVFGELLEHHFAVPHLSPSELSEWQRSGRKILLLDGRPLEEHRLMSIPGSICLPNGELAYRLHEFLPDASTPIVVHCAGRTRSIVGAQILRDLGIPNAIYALENGTQGWTLAGFTVERGSDRKIDGAPPPERQPALRAQSKLKAMEWAVPIIDASTLNRWAAEAGRTTYCFDVRSAEEFAESHIKGAVHAPGGQLLQSTDLWAPVRGARMVLVDDTGLRAVVVARLLKMMGWDCHVLIAARQQWRDVTLPLTRSLQIAEVAPAELPLPADAVVMDLRGSMSYRKAHIAGARWTQRWRLKSDLDAIARNRPIILCTQEDDAVGLAVQDLDGLGFARVARLSGGPTEWRDQGLDLVSTPDQPADSEALDFVFFTHDRHSGNLDAARRYLAWETGLVKRLSVEERKMFKLPNPVTESPSGHGVFRCHR